MKSLEKVLADLAEQGELNYICLVPVAGGFEATYTPASEFGHSYARHADPAKAILAAVAAMPVKGKRARNYAATYKATEPSINPPEAEDPLFK